MTKAAEKTIPSIPQAHAWLEEQGYDITERSVRNHVKQGLLPAERSRNGRVKSIRMIDLQRYAKKHLQRAASEAEDSRSELISLQADKLRLENDLKRGKYLLREAEEQRDAAVLAGLRRHLETSAPDRLQAILAEVLKQIDSETIRAAIVARQPEWLQRDMDRLADIFDEFHGA